MIRPRVLHGRPGEIHLVIVFRGKHRQHIRGRDQGWRTDLLSPGHLHVFGLERDSFIVTQTKYFAIAEDVAGSLLQQDCVIVFEVVVVHLRRALRCQAGGGAGNDHP